MPLLTHFFAEAEYTYQIRKDIIPLLLERGYKADGWLGVFVGTKLYNDFSSDDVMDASISRLVRELGNRGHLTRHASPAIQLSDSSFGVVVQPGRPSGQISVSSVSSVGSSIPGKRSHSNSECEQGM